jgi:hypothetical protein
MHASSHLDYGISAFGAVGEIAKMPIMLLYDLVRARQIMSSWTSHKGLSSDEVDIIVRMIAQGIAEGRRQGFELAGGDWPTDGKNHCKELKAASGAKS